MKAIALTLGLLSVTTVQPLHSQEPDRLGAVYASSSASWPSPTFAWVIDSLVTLIDLPVLRRVTLQDDARELRIWFGFGIPGPYGFVRILERQTVVNGELFRWGYRTGPYRTPAGDRESMRWSYHCEEFFAAPGYDPELCRVVLPPDMDWRAVLDSLEAYRIWVLPDGPERVVSDGQHLVVEIRDGKQYRTYYYSQPDLGESSEDIDAKAILDFAWWGLPRAFGKFWPDYDPAPCSDDSQVRSLISSYVRRPEAKSLRCMLHLETANMLDVEDLHLIRDDKICRRLSQAVHRRGRPPEYRTFHYRVGERFLVVDLGMPATIAAGCIRGSPVTEEFKYRWSPGTFCY